MILFDFSELVGVLKFCNYVFSAAYINSNRILNKS